MKPSNFLVMSLTRATLRTITLSMIISRMTLNVLKNDTQNDVTWQNNTRKTDTQVNDIKLSNILIMSLTRATFRAIPL
jgi:hypothetical protein